MDPFRYAQLLLKYRPRSEQEIRDKFKLRGYGLKETDTVVSSLKAQGLLDDFYFAKYWLKRRLAFNPRSIKLISYELKRKGVSESIIEDTIGGFCGINEREIAMNLANKKIKGLNRIKDFKKRQSSLYSYLSRRGFDYAVIKDIIQDIF